MQHTEGTCLGAGATHLYYQAWHPAAPPRAVVAILHGFTGHSGHFINVGKQLVPRGHAVYGLDLRGHGKSPGPRGHLRRWREYREDVDRFLSLMQELEPGVPIFLCGHSMGGIIALEYALHDPRRLAGVITMAPALHTYVSPRLFLLASLLSAIWPRYTINPAGDPTAISRDPAVEKAMQEDPLTFGHGTARLATEFLAASRWTQEHAAELQVPLLIQHGAADRNVPPEASRGFFERVTYPDRERMIYPDGYHAPFVDTNYEEVLADLAAWVERHLHE